MAKLDLTHIQQLFRSRAVLVRRRRRHVEDISSGKPCHEPLDSMRALERGLEVIDRAIADEMRILRHASADVETLVQIEHAGWVGELADTAANGRAN